MGRKAGLMKSKFPFCFHNLFDILFKIIALVFSRRKFYRFHNATSYFSFKILGEEKQSSNVFQIFSICISKLFNAVALVTLIHWEDSELRLFLMNSIFGNILPGLEK